MPCKGTTEPEEDGADDDLLEKIEELEEIEEIEELEFEEFDELELEEFDVLEELEEPGAVTTAENCPVSKATAPVME